MQEKKDALKSQRQKDRCEPGNGSAAGSTHDAWLEATHAPQCIARGVIRGAEQGGIQAEKLETVALITVFGAGSCNAADLLAESQKRGGREEEDDDEDGAHGEE